MERKTQFETFLLYTHCRNTMYLPTKENTLNFENSEYIAQRCLQVTCCTMEFFKLVHVLNHYT